MSKIKNNLARDAARYRWIKKQKCLFLSSEDSLWLRSDGSKFRASHALASNGTRWGIYETLDETIDHAMTESKRRYRS